jgi:hypothetical protein
MVNGNRPLTPLVKEILRQIADERSAALWEEYSCVRAGIWVRRADLPLVESSDVLDLGVVNDKERISALENGDWPTQEEIKLYHDWWVKNQLEGENDADAVPAYALAPIDDEDGHSGVALVLCKGYSFSGIDIWLEDIFESEGAAMNYMHQRGWCA